MFKFLSAVTVLAIISSIPYLVSWLRLRSGGSKKAMYDSAKYTIGLPSRLG
jgi:hypothetical protein